MKKKPTLSPSKEAENYYKKTQFYPISNSLWYAVQAYNRYQKSALDLGCGAFRDTKFLINCGFKVTAVDKDRVLKKFTDWAKYRPRGSFKFINKDVLDYEFPPGYFDIVNAQNLFSVNKKKEVMKMIQLIKRTLKPGGYVACDFLGLNDSWVNDKSRSFYTLDEAKRLFDSFIILLSKEHEEDSETVRGKMKHWHIINIIAQKPV